MVWRCRHHGPGRLGIMGFTMLGLMKRHNAAPTPPSSNLDDDADFDHLIGRQAKVGAGALGDFFEKYENAFAP